MTSPITEVQLLGSAAWTLDTVSLCADEVINARDAGGDEEAALQAYLSSKELMLTAEARGAVLQQVEARWFGSAAAAAFPIELNQEPIRK